MFLATPALIGASYVALIAAASGSELQSSYAPFIALDELVDGVLATYHEIANGRKAIPDAVGECGRALWFIARRHPFPNGNKRAAVLAMRLLARRNAVKLRLSNAEQIALVRGVACGELAIDVTLATVEARAATVAPLEVPPPSVDRLFARSNVRSA